MAEPTFKRVNPTDNPQWQSWQWAKQLFPPGAYDDFKNGLDTVRGILETFSEALDALQSLIALLTLLEGIVTDLFAGILQAAIDEIRSIVNDAKATGVYFLDLTYHNWIGRTFIVDEKEESNFLKGFLANEWGFNAPFEKTSNELELAADQIDRITAYFKKQTYREWINTAIDAFDDTDDRPSLLTRASFFDNPDESTGVSSTIRQKENARKDSVLAAMGPEVWNVFRPGRPDFGEKGALKCFVVAFTAPDVAGFLRLLALMTRLFYNAFLDQQAIEKMIRHIKELFEQITGTDFQDFWWSIFTNDAPIQTRGIAPDFYGLSVYQLFPSLFDLIDRLLNALESLFRKIESGLSDIIQDVIDIINEQIEDLKKLISIINDILDYIESLIDLQGFHLLEIGSTDGTNGIIAGLENASGMPGQDSNKPLFIGGALFCYGFPQEEEDDEGFFNFTEFWNDRTQKLDSSIENFDRTKKNVLDTFARIGT